MQARLIRKSAFLTTLAIFLSLLTFFQVTPASAAITLDASSAAFVFDHSGTAGVAGSVTAFTAKYTNIIGDGKSSGNVVRYNTVATVAGIAIDAVITTTLSGTTIAVYDSPGSASANTSFFQIDKPKTTGSITFNFSFYEHGTYTIAGSGNPVVLQNIKIYSIDIDGGDQYTSFSGFQNYFLTTSPATNLVVSQPSAGLVKFTSKSGVGNNSAIPADQVQVQYLSLSSINIQVGNGASPAYFGIGFGAASWTGATTPTATANPYNALPTSTNTSKVVTASTDTYLTQADFGTYADTDSNPFTQVKITQLPTSGKLQFSTGGIWSDVTLNQVVLVSDINLNKLRMNAPLGGTFKFMVHDSAAYSALAYTLTYTVTALSQTITFANPGTKILSATLLASNATASSSLTVSLASSTAGICTVSGLNISLKAEGACTIVASQAGNGSYSAATSVTQTFYISSNAAQTITFADPGTKVLNPNPLTVASGATSTSTGTVALTSFTADVCTISGLNIVLISTGSCQVRADQAGGLIGGITYAPASPVERIFAVTPVTYTLAYSAGSGGTIVGSASQVVATGTAGTTVTPTPNTGYHFTAWDDASTANPRTDTNVTSNISQAASFAINTYAVSYTAGSNGSLTGAASQTINFGANTTAISAVPASGYHFTAWADASTTNPRTDTNVTAIISQQASFAANTYTITYNKGTAAGAGGTQASQSGTGASVTLNASSTGTISRTGYVNSGWSITDGGMIAYANQAEIALSNNLTLTLYAVWAEAGSNSVIFHSNYGVSTNSSQSSNTAVNLSAVMFTRPGYDFVKWNTLANGTGTNYLNGASFDFAAAGGDLFALWQNQNYTLTYTTDTATVGTLPTQLINLHYTDTATVGSETGLTLTNFHFGGWNDGTSTYASGATYTVGTANIILTAVWIADSYSVTYLLNGGSGVTPTQAAKSRAQTFVVAASTGFTYSGFTFDGWLADTTSYAAGSTFTMGLTAVTLTAKWVENTYSITYNLDGGTGTLPTEASHPLGFAFTLADNALFIKAGYVFNGWSDGITNFLAGDSVAMGNVNVVLTARWVLNNHISVTYLANGASGTPPTEADHEPAETFVVAAGTALTRAGYTFTGWDDGTVAVAAGVTYTAGAETIEFTAQWSAISYSVTYAANSGTGTVPTESNKTIGQSFTVAAGTALTRSGFTFAGWNDAIANVGAGATYTVASANVVLAARWSAIVVAPPSAPEPEPAPKPTPTPPPAPAPAPTLTPPPAHVITLKTLKLVTTTEKKVSGSLVTLKQIVSTPTPTPTSTPATTPAPTPTPTPAPTPTPSSTSTVISKGEGISTVTLNSTQVSVVSEKGYSGVSNVVVEVNTETGTTTYTVPVTVNPIEPITPTVTLTNPKSSSITWTPDASAESYVVKVENKTVCVTTIAACSVVGLIGPSTDVTVQAQGNDATFSDVIDAVYVNKKPITALVVNFNTNSAKLDAIDKAQIRAVARTIVEQGFTHVVINGHTDIIGGVDNKALSAARAKATYDYLTQYAPNLDVKLGAFASTKPVAKGNSQEALAANRRAELGIY